MLEKWGITMKNILIVFILIFTILFCNSAVLADTKVKTITATAVQNSYENTEDLFKTGIRITFWLFPVIIGIAIIKNINGGNGKDKK
jgi:hypothetical protein